MTPALQKIVEAMGAEMQRQAEAYDPEGEGGFAHDTGRGTEWHVDGRFDLEKVARAGIEAVRDDASMDLTGLALGALPGGYRPGSHSAREIWMNKIDAILGEKP